MSLTNSPYWFGGGVDSFYPTQINDSLRWPTSGCQLYRTVGTPTDAKKHTHSFWVKVNPSTTQTLNSVYGNASGYYSQSGINSDGRIIFAADYARYYYATLRLRDPSSWVHILQVLDSTEASNSDRMKLYVNGVRHTSFTHFTTVPLNWTGSYHATNGLGLRIGRTYTGAGFQNSLLSYTSEYIFVDGQALDPTDFGQFKDGVWVPDTYAGTYGNNGYKLDFSNPANIGEDSSGNGNNFSVTALSAHDVMPDTPTNNFATFNPLDGNATSYSEGNLRFIGDTGGSYWKGGISTFGVDSGKWYWEMYAIDGEWANVGIMPSADQRGSITSTTNIDYLLNARRYIKDGTKSIGTGSNRTTSSYGASWTTGDIIGVALDMDAGTIVFYKNGSSQGTAFTGISGVQHPHATGIYSGSTIANFGQDSTFAGNTTAGGNSDGNGRGDFKYSVPSGYLALCTANLPEPTIVDGSEHFNTVIYTGNGSTQSITGVGFQPDVTWIKSRNVAYYHRIMDSVRGISNALYTNSTDPEGTFSAYDGLTSFDADGFTSDSKIGTNETGKTYVGWNWKAGTAFSNSAGSNGANRASSGRVNTDAGFSIVSYVGTSSASTIYHGLSSTPEFIIIKDRDYASGRPWGSYHFKLNNGVNPEDERIQLDESTGETNDTYIFNSTAPTSNVFSVALSSWNNTSGNDIIAYCFHSVDGYSKVGQYIGNYNVDGPFVYTGFRPAFILIKSAVTSGYSWYMMDSTRTAYNGSQAWLSPNETSTDDTSTGEEIDILSNGFKIRTNWTRLNDSGSPRYIYIAFAENPFKYANAR
jgi:hypothetical protein